MAARSHESTDYGHLRDQMVEHQIAGRGVRSRLVLDAMRRVQREGYVPSYLGEFAYDDTPLPIEEEQTISQPYIVAVMLDALGLKGGERVLEIGTGSGYAAAVLAEIVSEVYTIERHGKLAETARERLARDGHDNVHVRHGDGTLGWPDAAPFDAIVVAAGGPRVPDALRQQLAVGGRLVIPVGATLGEQKLERVTRVEPDRFEEESLGGVRFVPLIGAEGWHLEEPAEKPVAARRPARASLPELVAEAVEPFTDLERVDLDPLLDRIGDARVVLLGEASHGTSEFYALRARITRELVQRRGFSIVAAEADWPDAAQIDHHVRDLDAPAAGWQAFARFPTWMWRNRDVRAFVDWLRDHNEARAPEDRVRFAGLDLYSMYSSIDAVLGYLRDADPEAARVAGERYACLTPWQSDPASYGRAAVTQAYRSCEPEVVQMLRELLDQRLQYMKDDREAFFDALQNATLVANAELYYRIMYYGSRESWNLRDRHMFHSLTRLLDFHGPGSRAVVWAHNSHLGDARATEMSARGELNLGQLCREEFGESVYNVGFGTDHGTVAAASYWDGPLEVKRVRAAEDGSYERVFHGTSLPGFLLPLRHRPDERLHERLSTPKLERAIGVIYRPETELASHYFQAQLPAQFDEFIWIDETRAVEPLETHEVAGLPETYPFGL